MLLADRGDLRRAGRDGARDHRPGVIDDQQHADRPSAE
jgi:hypothetical protein